jgi:hypothetical protein
MPDGVAEIFLQYTLIRTSKIFLQYTHIRNTADVVSSSQVCVSADNPLIAFYDIHGRKGDAILLF